MSEEVQPTIIHEWTESGSRLGVDAKGDVWTWYNMDWTEGPDAEPSYWAPLSEVYPARDVGREIVRLSCKIESVACRRALQELRELLPSCNAAQIHDRIAAIEAEEATPSSPA